MEKVLTGKKIAILATDGFEESELLEPKKALEETGAEVDILSVKAGTITSWTKNTWGRAIDVDMLVEDVTPDEYDGLVLPGGVINADKIRCEEDAVEFVTAFVEAGKPIAAICHGAWILTETKMIGHRTMTSWPSLRTDLENAGAEWVDAEVVCDKGWVTSRKPADLPAFNEKMIAEFAEGKVQPGEERRTDSHPAEFRH